MAEIATSPGAGPRTGQNLNEPPPAPPDQGQRAKHRSLVDTQLDRQGAPGSGLGADAGSPLVTALHGLGLMQQGQQLISSALPALAVPLGGLIANLRQVIPQAMADQLAGIQTTGAAGPATGAPAPPPPGPPPPQAVPGAGAPGPPVVPAAGP